MKPKVIAIDGPGASGKGTLARRLAAHFDYACLDTGLLYRAVGFEMLQQHQGFDNVNRAIEIARTITLESLKNQDLRGDAAANAASLVAAMPQVRAALLKLQRDFAAHPPGGKQGAVLDGRDIGTVICPDADIKIYVTADEAIRASRRQSELQNSGITAIQAEVQKDLQERDARDKGRNAAPLAKAPDAYVLDTSNKTPDQTFEEALRFIAGKKERAGK